MQAARYGRIVNIASEAGRLGSRGGAVYAAAKGGVISFTRSIARENARRGITANVVGPGPIDTPMLRGAVEAGGQKLLESMTGATLAGPAGHRRGSRLCGRLPRLATEAAFITGEMPGRLRRNGVRLMERWGGLDGHRAGPGRPHAGWTRARPSTQMRRAVGRAVRPRRRTRPARRAVAMRRRARRPGSPPPGARDDRVLLYLHGGGFSLGSVRSHRGLVVALPPKPALPRARLEYRRRPEHRFPGGARRVLRRLRLAPASGVAPPTSRWPAIRPAAGWSLATMLARAMAARPLPAAAVLLSAFTDLTASGRATPTRAASTRWTRSPSAARVARALPQAVPSRARRTASPLFADSDGLAAAARPGRRARDRARATRADFADRGARRRGRRDGGGVRAA